MLKLTAMLATTTAMLALASTAQAADKSTVKSETTMEQNKNGGYDKTSTSERTNASGRVASESEVKLEVDRDGESEKTTTIKHTDDPKGLMNKHTDKTVVREKNEQGKTTLERTRKVDGKTVIDSSSEVTH